MPEQDGFILPAVLAVLVVVAGAAALATQSMQTRLMETSGRASLLRLQGAADGIARAVAFGLIAEHTRHRPGLGLPENGTSVACMLPEGGGEVQISVQDQAGLIDLNASPRQLMEDAFRTLGVADHDAATIAAEIVDYRDPDDDPEPGGAEAAQYKARGLAYGPRNAPLTSIAELDLLPSMTAAIAARIRPAVTVYNSQAGIDPAYIPVSSMVESVAGETLREYEIKSPHRYYEVRVAASSATGARAGRGLMLSTGDSLISPGVFAWRQVVFSTSSGREHAACKTLVEALGAR